MRTNSAPKIRAARRLPAIAFMALALAAVARPAAAEQLLICEDEAATGFRWEGGKPVKRDFELRRFSVRIERHGKRVIKFRGEEEKEIEYTCIDDSYTKTTCTRTDIPAYSPITFEEDRFERVHNYSPHGAFDLYVALGSCTKF